MEVEGKTAEVTEVVREEGQDYDMSYPALSNEGKTWVSSPFRS